MNITPHLPYWSQGRIYPNRFELKPAIRIESWQHPEQLGETPRPDGHEILRVIEAHLLHKAVGLATLMYYQQHLEQQPKIFQGIHMCGWLDVVNGPYSDRLFVPTLTPVSSGSKIHWMDLNSGFNCLDWTPLRQRG